MIGFNTEFFTSGARVERLARSSETGVATLLISVAGAGHEVDLRTPVERGRPWGFEWSPGEMRLPMDKIQGRYDADVWARFLGWTAGVGLEGGEGGRAGR